MPSEYYSYCFVRQDLSAAQQVVQAGHAWWEVARQRPNGTENHYIKTNFVLIGVPDEQELMRVRAMIARNHVICVLFHEPDLDQFTALATAPIRGEQRAPFLDYELLGSAPANFNQVET